MNWSQTKAQWDMIGSFYKIEQMLEYRVTNKKRITEPYRHL